MYRKIQLEREALYEEVWSVPMSRLAPKYGLSGNGLKKICKKLNIPVPFRGYWTRIQYGYKVKKDALSKLKRGDPDTYTLQMSESQKTNKMENKEENLSHEAFELVDSVNKKRARIIVPQRLTNSHPLVRQTYEILKASKPDKYGVLRPWRKDYLNIRVSPGCLTRVLRIMNTVVKVFESVGLEVSGQQGRGEKLPTTSLKIFDEVIRFSLEEKVRRIDHIPTEKEKKEMERWSWSHSHKWDYRPTGNLFLRYDPWGWGHDGLRKTWADGATRKLEDMVADFVIGGIKIGDAMRKQTIVRKEEELRRQEELRRWEEAERLKQLELERLGILEKQVEQWSNSQRLRDFIQAVEEAFRNQSGDSDFQQKLDGWLLWAQQHADNLDPLQNGFPWDQLSIPEKF